MLYNYEVQRMLLAMGNGDPSSKRTFGRLSSGALDRVSAPDTSCRSVVHHSTSQ